MGKWAVNGFKQNKQTKKWTIKKFGEKILQRLEVVVQSSSTDCQL